MYGWHARREPRGAGEDPEVLVGDESPLSSAARSGSPSPVPPSGEAAPGSHAPDTRSSGDWNRPSSAL